MELRVDGKRALVTGASSGFGRHFAMTLANAGADVAIAARRVERLESLAGEISAKTSRKAHAVALDLSDTASIAACAESTAAAH